MIIIDSEPKSDVYWHLIDLAFDICDEFILVVRKEIDLNDKGKSVLEKLNPHLEEMKEQSKWAGTELACGRTAYVYHYHINPEAREIIKEVSNSLYAWMQQNFPEDLSFYKNGKPWLANIAHEKMSYILSENKSEIDRIVNIKGLEIRIK